MGWTLTRGGNVASALGRSPLLLFAVVGIGYALCSQLAFSWFEAGSAGASFFPAAGVTLAALVLVAKRRWPIVLAAAACAELVVDQSHDLELAATAGYILANVTEPLVGALLLLSFTRRVDLGHTRDLALFLACAVVAAPALGGTIGATSNVLLDEGDNWARFAGQWWVGDGLGVLVVGGAILVLGSVPPRHASRVRILEAGLLAAAATLTAAATFQFEWFGLVYVPVALLVVLAFRVGTRGVALTGAVVAFVVAEATAQGHTFWEGLSISPSTALLYLQLALGVLIASCLALAAEINQRDATALELARTEEARRLAVTRGELYESEREARARAELLEQNAGRLSAASSPHDVARTTVTDLESLGIDIAAVRRTRGDAIEVLAATGVPAATIDRYRGMSLTEDDTPSADAMRTGRVIAIDTADEMDARYPGNAPLRRELGIETTAIVPLRSQGGAVIGALSVNSREREWLTAERRQLVIGIAEQTGLALERAELLELTEATGRRVAFLAGLTESVDEATTMDERAARLVTGLVEGREAFAAVHLLTADGAPRLAASAGRAPDVDLEALAGEATRHGLRRQGDLTVYPLQARGRMLGALSIAADVTDLLDEGFGREIAARASISIDNAGLYERERDVSHSLQLGLLGASPAAVDGTVVASAYRPGTAVLEVGGDWHDSFPLAKGTLALVVGDVVGHGLEAAVAMGQLRGAVRALAPTTTPTRLLEQLDSFVETIPGAAMATLAYVELHPDSGRILYCCAGHPPPLVVSATREPRFLWEGRSTPLGSSFDVARTECEDALEPGETLVVYTDGLIERRDHGLGTGLDRLLEAAAQTDDAPPAAIVENVLAALLGTEAHEDDVCVLAARFEPALRRFSQRFPASRREVTRTRKAFAAWLEELELDQELRRDAALALSEAAANAAKHGYAFNGVGVVKVEAELDREELRIVISDGGGWQAEPAAGERGRGARIIDALMDEVTTDQTEDGTIVSMTMSVKARLPR
jgi:serine/threonine-protein kinase RsbW